MNKTGPSIKRPCVRYQTYATQSLIFLFRGMKGRINRRSSGRYFVRHSYAALQKENGVASNHRYAPKWKIAIARSRDRVMWTIRKRRSVRAANVSHLGLESHRREWHSLRRPLVACVCIYIYICVYLPGGPWDLRSRGGRGVVRKQYPPTMIPDDARHRRRRGTCVMAYLWHWPEWKTRARLYDTDTRRVSARHRNATDPRRPGTMDRERLSHERQADRLRDWRKEYRAKSLRDEGRSATDLKYASVARGNGRAVKCARLARSVSLAPTTSVPPLSRIHSAARSPAIRIPVNLSRAASHDYFLRASKLNVVRLCHLQFYNFAQLSSRKAWDHIKERLGFSRYIRSTHILRTKNSFNF